MFILLTLDKTGVRVSMQIFFYYTFEFFKEFGIVEGKSFESFVRWRKWEFKEDLVKLAFTD